MYSPRLLPQSIFHLSALRLPCVLCCAALVLLVCVALTRAPLSVPPFSQIIQCLLHLFVANFISLFVYFHPPHLTLSSLFLSVALKGRMDSTDMRLMHVVTLAGLFGVLGTIRYGPISCNMLVSNARARKTRESFKQIGERRV